MKSLLRQEDIKMIESRIRDFENKTGCELLMVVANSSDPYPAASLRFGVISGFILSFLFALFFEFTHHTVYPLSFIILVLFMTWVGHFEFFKKFALSEAEVQRETAEKAVECFFNLGSSKVSHKVTAMIMVSLLEHKIHVLVDEKLQTKLSQDDLNRLVEIMKEHFSKGNMAHGILQSMEDLELKILTAFNGKACQTSSLELKDTIQFIGF